MIQKNRLILPDRDYRENHAYGDLKVTSKYLGIKYIPRYISGEWQHGWIYPERNIHPEFVIGSDGKSFARRKTSLFFVARKDQVEYLKSEGYEHVEAIGMPIIYLKKPQVTRISNSLLIMPVHSLDDTQEKWQQHALEYEQYIKDILNKFSHIVVCLHPVDIKKNVWPPVFKSLGIDIVEGAIEKDANSLERMACLFGSFEFMTTNGMGSHVAYASYYGCKVSVSGPKKPWKRSDFKRILFYKNAPEVLDILEDWHSCNYLESVYSDFFVQPYDAINKQSWAAWQLGEQCKRSPKELRRLFCWDYLGLSKYYVKSRIKKIQRINHDVAKLLSVFGVYGFLVAYQLFRAKNAKSGYSRIYLDRNSRSLKVRNGSSDLDVMRQHFIRKELYGIAYPTRVNTIYDLGANIGISVEVFRRLFPKALIVAVEMNLDNFKLLEENHADDECVIVVHGAVWSSSGVVGCEDVGEGEWAYRVKPAEEKDMNVTKSFTFPQLLEMVKISRVDVLKMDIEGAEVDVLNANWREIIGNTKLLIMEVHDWIPGCSEAIKNVLDQAANEFKLKISKCGEFSIIENLDF